MSVLEEKQEHFAYVAVATVLETIVEVEALISENVNLACEQHDCVCKASSSLFSKHSIQGKPLGGADWNREFSLYQSQIETHFLFDLSVDHNSSEIEICGTIDFDGTYGYELLRETCRVVPKLDDLKDIALEVVEDLFSQIDLDLKESARRNLAAPTKAEIAKQSQNNHH